MMKNSILLFFMTLIVFSGCQKKYTCNCTDGASTIVHTVEIETNTETEARDNCRSIGTECDLL